MKKCRTCGETKPLEGFGRLSKSEDGHNPYCKACRNKHAENARRRAGVKPLRLLTEDERRLKRRLKSHNRRQREKDGSISLDDWNALIAAYGEKCMFPGCENTELLELDHVIPLAFYGEHSLTNSQILCQFHNRQKGWRSCADYRPFIAFGEQHIEHEIPVGLRNDVLRISG